MIYKVITSNKFDFRIDQADYEKLSENVGAAKLVRLKQAIVNPSFIVAIVPIGEPVERKIEGHVDEKRGVYIVTKDERVETVLRDQFKTNKLLNENND